MKILITILLGMYLSSCTLLKSLIPVSLSSKKSPPPIVLTSAHKKEHKKWNKTLLRINKAIKKRALKTKEIRQLNHILKTSSSPVLKKNINIILGHYYFQNRSYKKSLYYYKQISKELKTARSLLEEAKIYYYSHQYPKMTDIITTLLNKEQVPHQWLTEAYKLKEAMIIKTQPNNKIALLKVYCAILEYEIQKKALYKKQAQKLLFNLTENQILQLTGETFIEPIKGLVFFRAGQILFDREKFHKSYAFFKKSIKFSTQSKLEEQALKYIQAMDSRHQVNSRHIGAILPLSGPSSAIGKKSLHGLQMGLGFYNEQKKGILGSPSFQLAILDSRGLPDTAKKAVKKLVTQHHVIGIIGGVLSKTAPIIAREAQNFGVPTILLSQKTKLTQTGEYIFQNGLTSHLIVEPLVHFLINSLSIKNFALLYPNDHYGVDYANAFWQAVTNNGGRIRGVQAYKPGETDFNEPIRRLIGTYYKKDRIHEYKERLKTWYAQKPHISKRRGPLPDNILPPIVDFEVLFVPDSIKALNLIAPHITYNNIKNVFLAGSHLWNRPASIKKQAKYVEKIFFTSTGLSETAFKTSDFYQQFKSIFGQKPGLFETQAYESALAFRQVIIAGATTRQDLRKNLAEIKSFHGPTSPIQINSTREFRRPLSLFKMEKKQITLIQRPDSQP